MSCDRDSFARTGRAHGWGGRRELPCISTEVDSERGRSSLPAGIVGPHQALDLSPQVGRGAVVAYNEVGARTTPIRIEAERVVGAFSIRWVTPRRHAVVQPL